MFSNKSMISQPWSGLMPKNNVIQGSVYWTQRKDGSGPLLTTQNKATDNNQKTETRQTPLPPLARNNKIQRGRKSPAKFGAALLSPLCLFLPKLKWPAACLTSILKKPHLMLVLLQGIINSLDNEVKLSRMECFSSPSVTFFTPFPTLYPCSLTCPAEILFCLCALRTYWSQRGMNCIPRAFFSFVRKN